MPLQPSSHDTVTCIERSGLDWVLAPATRAEFFAEHWERRPLLVARADAAYFDDLPGLDAVDDLITATATAGGLDEDGRLVKTAPDGNLSERRFQLTSAGVVDIQDIYRAYADGYSVVVNRLHCRSARLASLSRRLEVDFHCPIGVNMYLSPAGSQGFRPHVDTHDVFILQLHGTKEWHVASPVKALPLASSKSTRLGSLGEHDTFHLGPGDTLYVPRGFPHEAVTAVSSSLHLTVSINVFRWIDLLAEMLGMLAEEHVNLRRALAPTLLDGPVDPVDLERVAALVAEGLRDPRLAEDAKNRLAARLLAAGKSATSAHFASIDQHMTLTESSLVRRPRGYLCRVGSDGREARIEFASNFVAGPARLEPAFRFIAEREHFCLRDLPGQLSAREKVDLVDRLISEGLLIRTNSTNGAEHD